MLGIGLIKLSTTMWILALKLHIKNKRIKSRESKLI